MPADSAKSVSMSGSSAERAARAPLGCITEDIQTANNSADTSTPPQTFEHPTLPALLSSISPVSDAFGLQRSREATPGEPREDESSLPSRSERIPLLDAEPQRVGLNGTVGCERHTAGQPVTDGSQQPWADGMSAAALQRRAEAMFLQGQTAPVASQHGQAAPKATFGLVAAVNKAARQLWAQHSAAIRERCAAHMPKGLIALQEVFGFLLADALGRPLLPGDKAMAVGQSGDNALRTLNGTKARKGLLPSARDAMAAAVRKAKRAAHADPAQESCVAAAEAAGKKRIASVLAMQVELSLPSETVGKRKRPVEVAQSEE